ncbi:MAG TPA: serine/threonine-protein kinase [Polyangiaceae bacterium]|nr:serine/threonine-protein kinase [Polyangiaceae bacterium]
MVAETDATGFSPGYDPLLGTVVGGRFRIENRIARGGMSSVYFAVQAPLNRPVALKVLRGSLGEDAESADGFRRRFLQEASILSQLSHPNIVTLLEYGQVRELPEQPYFMAMEYLRGETLAQRFRARGRLGVDECIRLARQIGRGLRQAHRRGFVHRDLKPSNIMLVPEDDGHDIVKLVDFGIGKILRGPLERDVEDQTRVGLLLGSPRHMAPEQIRCEPVEVRTDLYGLGVILFQALTGRLPFDGRTEIDVLMAHCSMPAPALNEACPEQPFPESLASLVQSLLAKSPSGRPSVDEFLQSLSEIEQELFGRVGLAGPTSRHVAPTLRSPTRAGAESEDHTEVTLAEWRSQDPPLTGGAGVVSLAPHSLAAPRPKKRGRWAVAGAVVALAGVAGFTLQNLRAQRAESAVKARSQPAAVVPARVARATPPVPDDAPTSSFALTISSSPTSATVSENGAPIGTTPLSLSIARDSVAGQKRRFVIEQEGFAPYTIEQGDSATSVSVLATLVASARKSARSRVSRGNSGGTIPTRAGEGFAAKRNDAINLDIRPRR